MSLSFCPAWEAGQCRQSSGRGGGFADELDGDATLIKQLENVGTSKTRCKGTRLQAKKG